MPHAASRSPCRLRTAAVLAALTFGCATVRAPASEIAVQVPVEGGRAEPQLELWIEGNRQPSPKESSAAATDARAALVAALAGRDEPVEDMVLVVRAQGVTRTAGRRSDQRAAMVGLVVGAVVLVAVVVVAIVASGKGGGGGGGAVKAVGAVARGGAHARPPPLVAAAPAGHSGTLPAVAGAVARRPPSPGPWLPPARRPPPPGTPAPGPVLIADRGPRTTVSGELDLHLGPGPQQEELGPPAPAPEEEGWAEASPPPPAAEAVSLQVVALEPPPRLPVESRGFFQGDSLLLELVLVDRHSGRPLWRKTVERDVDPRNAPQVRAMLDEALAVGAWTPVE